MNEQLSTLHKKLQSTHDELARVKATMIKDSPEYLLSLHVLETRLSFLHEQETKMSAKEASGINIEDLPYITQIALSQDTSADLFSLRAVSHFLFGFQHLIDSLTKEPGDKNQNDTSTDLLLQFIQGSPLALELRASDTNSETLYKNALQHLSQLLNISDLNGKIPTFLLELEPRVFSYAKKWMTFLVDNGMVIHSDFTGLQANRDSLKHSLGELNHIRKEMSEPILISGILNGISLSDRYLELLEPQTLRKSRVRTSYSFLMENRELLGELITLQVNKLLTENTVTGEMKSLLQVNSLINS